MESVNMASCCCCARSLAMLSQCTCEPLTPDEPRYGLGCSKGPRCTASLLGVPVRGRAQRRFV
eukprot:355293-Chlamydomonas_euryale.AAC.2